MYADIIQATRKEVLRLLGQQDKIMEELLNTPSLLKSQKDDKQIRSLSEEGTQLWRQTLKEESYKVDRLEMTLAVVGTMKAGKSTTINAIVGSEVLPNRNIPMTTLPTLIRHTPEKDIPKLTFPKPEPFNVALKQLNKELKKMQEKGKLDNLETMSSEDGAELINSILTDSFSLIHEEYNGLEEIYVFLKKLNDISRLCEDKQIKVTSPLIEYDSIDEFPQIEIEFYHLKNSTNENGTFTLIDTPGPNEAGAKYLKQILIKQIEKASAVMAVLDYTQLRSEADEEVRQSLKEILEYGGDRLYLFVNKFDQKDKNGMDKEETRRYVTSQLFEGRVDSSKVYPVSSKRGYLANQVLRQIETDGRLPSYQENEWVSDFGESAFGVMWASEIDDIEEVKKKAKKLWNISLFDEPLAEVIKQAFSEAGLISMKSAVDKMYAYDQQVIDSLGLRFGGLQAKIELLQQHIDNLEGDIKKVKESNKKAQDKSKKTVKEMKDRLKEILEKSSNVLDIGIDSLFKEEKSKEKEREIENREQRKENTYMSTLLGAISAAIGTLPKEKRDSLDINPNGPNIFTKEEKAKEFVNSLYDVINESVGNFSQEVEKHCKSLIKSIEKDLWGNIEREMGSVLKEAAIKLNESFEVKIQLSSPKPEPMNINFDLIQQKLIKEEEKKRTGTRYERRWYTLWLYEHEVEYTYTEKVYEVDAKAIGSKAKKALNKKYDDLEKALHDFINKDTKKKIDEYFKELELYLERFRGDLLDAKKDKKLEEKDLQNLLVSMKVIKENVTEHSKDVKAVKVGIENEGVKAC
ncbi:Dynamin family protein [Natronincola peptidivorans]|uniref:Dynamin family protein n=1 Tax=Natronincola peptidivorans TaxID=426128 RepID=A0A1I0EKB3_9FIRM|nr:dynamin family protein [Natronincola peptidivorans]SET45735.1 Dynamin family protein [Natronincola peptidivorans]